MHKRLYIMRHAKSDWSRSVADDQRPLNKRGTQAARRMGRWMRDEQLSPARLCSSTARRAEQTVLELAGWLDYPPAEIHWDERLYLASVDTLLDRIAAWLPGTDSLMLVGHNPGLEGLLRYLVPGDRLADHGKQFPTAALAVLDLPAGEPAAGRADLVRLQRPRDLDD